MNDVALVVAQDLELDVVRVLNELLDIDPGVAKGLLRLAARRVVAFDQGNIIMGYAHAPPTTAGDGLDYDRVANAFGHHQSVLLVVHDAFRAGRGWHIGFLSQCPADSFVLQRIHGAGVRSDKADVAALAHIGEVRILGQEPIAGVNGIHVRDLGCTHYPINPQIALAGGGFADADGLVGQLDVHRVGIRFRVDRYRADVKLLAGADDANGDFPAVRNQDFLKHAWRR